MKKFTKVLSIVLCLSVLISCFVLFTVQTGAETVLIDEDFESSDVGVLPMDWTVNTGTGLVAKVDTASWQVAEPTAVKENKALYISHLFYGDSTSVIYDFERSQSVTLSFDYSMGSVTNSNGLNGFTFWAMPDGYTGSYQAYFRMGVRYVSDTVGVLAYHDGANFVNVKDSSGNDVLVNKGEWYNIELCFNGTSSSNTTIYYKLSQDGKEIVNGSFVHSSTKDVNRITLHGYGTAYTNDSFYVDNVYINTGSSELREEFDSVAVGEVPAGFAVSSGQADSVKVVASERSNNKALYLARLETSGNDGTQLIHDFASAKKTSVSLDYQMESLTNKIGATVQGLNGITFWSMKGDYSGYNAYYRVAVYRVSDNKGKLVGHNGSSYIDLTDKNGNIVEIERGKVYHFDVSCDTSKSKTLISYKVSLDGVVIADGSYEHSTVLDVNRISIHSTGSSHYNDQFYIDNLEINDGTTVIKENFESFLVETARPALSGITYVGDTGTARAIKVVSLSNIKNDEEATGAFVTHSTKALYVEDTCDWQGPVITYAPFIAVSDLTLTFDYMLATDKIYSATGFALGGGGTNTENLKVYFKVFPNTDGEGRYTGTSTLKYFNASSWSWVNTPVTDIVPNRWYNFRIEVANGQNTAKLYLDGEKICDVWTSTNIERMDRVVFQSNNSAGTGDKFFIDNINITTQTEINDDFMAFEDDFSSGTLPKEYKFTGSGKNTLSDGELALNGPLKMVRSTSSVKSARFSFSVKTDSLDGLYFGLSDSGTEMYRINVDSDGYFYYSRDKGLEVALNTRKLIKTNEWVDITIDIPYDRNTTYAYLYVNGQMGGHIIQKSIGNYVNEIFVGAENGTTVTVKNVKCEPSKGVIAIPERTESDPVAYVPEVVDGKVIYLKYDSLPTSSTLSEVGDEPIVVDSYYSSIGVDLGSIQKVNALRYTTAATTETKVSFDAFTVYKSDDNANWETVKGYTYNHLFEDGKWVMLFEFSGVEARYVKIRYSGSKSTDITIEDPKENVRAERRIDRQWKMAGQNMVALGDALPEHTAMTKEFVDEGIVIKTGDSIGINFGLISPVEAVELVANGLSGLGVNDIEVYSSNDNIYYSKINGVILSRDTRDGKDVHRLTFDSIECAYLKLYVKGEGIEIHLDNMLNGLCAYSSEETDSVYLYYSKYYDAEGDYFTLPDGSLVMTYKAYGAGAGGDFDDCEILARMSTDGGATWGESWVVLDKFNDSVNIMQSRVFWLENEELGIVYHEKNPEENRSNIYFRRSYDLGRNWEDPVQITEMYDSYYSGMSSGNCVNRLANGRIIFMTNTCEIYTEVYGSPHVKVFVWYSDDEGYTWNRSDGVVVLPNTTCEASVAVLENGDLLMSMRTRLEGKIYQSISTDNGNTWAQPVAVADLVTPSSTNTVVTVPATGDVLLMWNNEFATDNGTRRNQSAAVSSDNGLTYKNIKTLIEGRCVYPVIQFFGRSVQVQFDICTNVYDVESFYYTTSGAVTVDDLTPASTPKAKYADGWLTNVSSTMKYSLDGGATWMFCGGSSVQIGEVRGEIWVQDIGTSKLAPSSIQIVGKNDAEPVMSKAKTTLNNERLTLGSSHVMYNKTAEVEFKVDDIAGGEIIIAHGDVNARVVQSSCIKITKDKLVSETVIGRDVLTYLDALHGLDISGKVKVSVRATYDKAVVIIETENGQYVSEPFSWLGRNGDVFVEAKNTTVKNVDFSWYCSGYDEDIWFMGDSFFDSSGLAIPTGWPYFAIKDGNTNACWFGFGGRRTEQALDEFKNALNYGTPKYAVWCVGMNNEDVWSLGDSYNDPDSWTVNSTWKWATDEFLAICEEKGITPILATVPNTKERINYFKNQVVKSSGYRYIDQSLAVGANDTAATSGWMSGYRHTDNLHPTALGAEAIYNRVLKDFPELKGN